MQNGKINVCIVGCGMMGTIHAESWRRLPFARVQAVVDILPDRAESLARLYGLQNWYTDYHQAICLPEIDAVSICIPTHLHAEAAVYAARQGKHVLCEKPVALQLDQARAMLAAAYEQQIKLGMGFMRRHSEVMSVLHGKLQSGMLGRPLFYQASDFREIRPKLEMHDTNANGGPVIDMAVHLFDTWAFLFESTPVEVMAYGQRLGKDRPELNSIANKAWDTASINVRYASGDLGIFHVSWGLPPGINPQPAPERVLGPRGLVEAAFSRTNQSARWLQEGGAWETIAQSDEDMYHREIASFASSILEETPLRASGEDGLRALLVARAAVESIETGLPVEIYPV